MENTEDIGGTICLNLSTQDGQSENPYSLNISALKIGSIFHDIHLLNKCCWAPTKYETWWQLLTTQ